MNDESAPASPGSSPPPHSREGHTSRPARSGSRRRRADAAPTLPPQFQPESGRELALMALHRHEQTGRFVQDVLDEIVTPDFDRHERRLAMELACGIVRRRIPLSLVLQHNCNRPRHQVDGLLWTLMRLGGYQLLYTQGIPPHAAIHETVELCRRIGRREWTGFLNGVLRGVQRTMTGESGETPAVDMLPLHNQQYLRLTDPVFADPAADPASWCNQALSLPGWLAKRWAARMSAEELFALGWWFLDATPVTLRVNLLRTTREALLDSFAAAGIEATAGGPRASVRLHTPRPVHELPGFSEGHFCVQDESAMWAATLLAPKPGDHVLDLCSAPGTKTTHLAELMGDEGLIIAADASETRLRRVTQNAQRLGLTCIRTEVVDREETTAPAGPFQRVLIDVPCSNSGVLGKRPEARWRIDASQLKELPRMQERLLLAGSRELAPGGHLVYSTCSIEPEENRQVVQHVLSVVPGLQLVRELQHLPGQPADGGYQVLLKRTE